MPADVAELRFRQAYNKTGPPSYAYTLSSLNQIYYVRSMHGPLTSSLYKKELTIGRRIWSVESRH